MRLVAWNANYNSKKRSFDDALALVAPLHADLVVLSETALPGAADPRRVRALGGAAPGLAVVASESFELAPSPSNDGALPWLGAFAVRGRVDFTLVAAWPTASPRERSYHRILMHALDRFAPQLAAAPAILAGDLNSSSRVAAQRATHPAFVARAGELGLVSAYHAQTGEAHGEESVPTYLHAPSGRAPFHVDYCFVSRQLAPAANLTVLRAPDWTRRSDHFPLVLDLPDAAFGVE